MSHPSLRPFVLALPLCLALTGLAGCKSAVDEKPKAKVEDAEPANEADAGGGAAKADEGGEPAGDAKTLALTEASKVSFLGAKQVGDHTGTFSKVSGSASVADGKLEALEIIVDMSSLSTDTEPDLTEHMKGADFFEVETYPESKFTMISVTEKAGENGATHEVVGNLEIKGQAKKVTFPATVSVSDAGVSGKADFSIDRTLWGITYPGKADNLIKDEVGLTLDLQFQ